MKINKKQSNKKRRLVAALIIAAIFIAAGSLVAYKYLSQDKNAPSGSNIESELGKDNSDNKDVPGASNNTPDKETPPAQTPEQQSQLSPVTPFISYFGRTDTQLEVNAIVPGINEEGTCTLTVKNGSGNIVHTESKPAHSDAQSTVCENFLFADSGANTSWKATVSYKSQLYSGDSQPTPFN